MFDTVILSNKLVPVFKPSVYRAIKSVRPFAMISRNRLQSLHRLLHMVDRDGVKGAIVEAGIAKGGSVVFFAMLTAKSRIKRQVWGFDAFELFGQQGAGVYDEVCTTIRDRFGFGENDVKIVKGFFNETLKDYPGDAIALYHIDASDYETVVTCIEELYPYVQPGGVVVFDNYGSNEGCAQAIDEWIGKHGLADQLKRYGHAQCYFFKPK